MLPPLRCDDGATRPIRVLVVDVHAAVRHAVATLVGSCGDLELAGEAASGEDALRHCERACPDVVMMAVSLPGLSSAETTRTMVGRWPQVKVLGMSTFQEEEKVPEMLRAGAVSYLLKNVSADELVYAIHRAYVQ